MDQHLTDTALDAAIDDIEAAPAPPGLDTKALPSRRPAPTARPAAKAGTETAREAIIAIGKGVIEIGRKVNEMKAAGQLPHRRDLHPSTEHAARRMAEAKRRMAEAERRASLAEIKANRPPGLASRWPGLGGAQTPTARMRSIQKAAFVQYLRKGLHSESEPAGGYLVFPERRGGVPLDGHHGVHEPIWSGRAEALIEAASREGLAPLAQPHAGAVIVGLVEQLHARLVQGGDPGLHRSELRVAAPLLEHEDRVLGRAGGRREIVAVPIQQCAGGDQLLRGEHTALVGPPRVTCRLWPVHFG